MERANQHAETSSAVSSLAGVVQVDLFVSSLLFVDGVTCIVLLDVNKCHNMEESGQAHTTY